MDIPELVSTSVFELTSPPKKQLQIGLESGIVPDHLVLKSLCARQRVAKPILARPSIIIVATKSVRFTRKLRMLLPAAKLRGSASNAAGKTILFSCKSPILWGTLDHNSRGFFALGYSLDA
jgi:hypothetical protein